MADVRVRRPDEDCSRSWERVTREPNVLGVVVSLCPGEWQWRIDVGIGEFVRDEPLESRFDSEVTRAVRHVDGVTDAIHEDREVWAAKGKPDGPTLVRAVGHALDSLAPELRGAYSG